MDDDDVIENAFAFTVIIVHIFIRTSSRPVIVSDGTGFDFRCWKGVGTFDKSLI